MKIAPEHLIELSNQINSNLSNYTEEQVKKHRRTIKYAKNQFVSFCWSIFNNCTTRELRNTLYSYLNDSHVETAIKSILSKYEAI